MCGDLVAGFGLGAIPRQRPPHAVQLELATPRDVDRGQLQRGCRHHRRERLDHRDGLTGFAVGRPLGRLTRA